MNTMLAVKVSNPYCSDSQATYSTTGLLPSCKILRPVKSATVAGAALFVGGMLSIRSRLDTISQTFLIFE
jgi:hypothetical protein